VPTGWETDLERKKKYGSCGPETENDCAGEGQQRITAVKHRLPIITKILRNGVPTAEHKRVMKPFCCRGHTRETGHRNVTAISENCYQPGLNTCY
jgi:hypothetical protein